MGRLLLIFVLLAACVRTSPQPPSEQVPVLPLPIVVPPGCLEVFSGSWVHASNPGYRYEAEDDGGTLSMVVTRVLSIDAGFSPRRFRPEPVVDAGPPPPAADAGQEQSSPVRVELRRTENGFVGATIAPLTHPTGRVCEARFPTTVISCVDGGLLLETQSATALGDACQAPARPLGLLTQKHQLWRPDAG